MGLPLLTFVGLAGLLTLGTVYSVLYQTYLDTSDPLLSYAPHPLADTHYFASKKSLLNTVFIKNAWGWTSAVFFLLFILGSKLPADPFPRTAADEEVEEKQGGRFVYRPVDKDPKSKRKLVRWEDLPSESQLLGTAVRPVLRWIVLTGAWALFTAWFFGPAILTRVTLATGGECVLVMPPASTDADTKLTTTAMPTNARVFPVPAQLCHNNKPVGAETHPALFANLFANPAPDGTSSALDGMADLALDELVKQGYKARPRIRRGHDVSGHVFLLTVAALFLAELIQGATARLGALQVRVPKVHEGVPAGMNESVFERAVEHETRVLAQARAERLDESLNYATAMTKGPARKLVEKKVAAYKFAVGVACALLGVWFLATYTTAIYFHTPFEKLTGFVLGAATYAFSLYLMPNRSAVKPSTATTSGAKKAT